MSKKRDKRRAALANSKIVGRLVRSGALSIAEARKWLGMPELPPGEEARREKLVFNREK